MTREPPTRDAIDPNQPIRLALAAELVYGKGGMTASGLRREAARGRLRIEKFDSGTWYTTLNWMDAMRELALKEAGAKVKPQPIQCVYVVGFGPYVKIGFTADHFQRRLRALHGGFPEQLTTYATIPNGTRELERALHTRFAAHRLQYEWFRYEGELAAWIEAGCPS